MYECRCPHDGKKLAEIARPPLALDHYDLREAAQKRHEFSQLQAGRLHFSYILPQKAQEVTALKAVTY